MINIDNRPDYYDLKTSEQLLGIFLEYAQGYGLLKSSYSFPEALVAEGKKVCLKITAEFCNAYGEDNNLIVLLRKYILPNCFYSGMLSIAIWDKYKEKILRPSLYENLVYDKGLLGLIDKAKELNHIFLGRENSLFERALSQLCSTILDNCPVGKKQGRDFLMQQLHEYAFTLFLMGANISCDRLYNKSNNNDSNITSTNLYCEFVDRELVATNFWEKHCQRCYCFF